jgi:hypothetical protein
VVESVLPWGIPCVMVLKSDCACCVCTDCCRVLKYDSKKEIVSVVKLNSCFSFRISFLCEIVSYAFERSM